MRSSCRLLAIALAFSATTSIEAQVRHGYERSPAAAHSGDNKGRCPSGGINTKPRNSCPPVHCPGPGSHTCHPYPSLCVPQRPCWDWWYPRTCGYGPPTIYPPIFVDGLCDTSLFNSWFAGWHAIPYYDTDPVQFAYTPIDIPPRAPVARPERAAVFTRVVPRQIRRPLYELSAAPRRTDGQK
jgi:hypothetical protein